MKIEQIIYLKDIRETNSMTQTAQRFFITPQALSYSINKLEEEFGVTFLKRSNQGALLTKEGMEFLRFAEPLLCAYENLKKNFESVASDKLKANGVVKIAVHVRLMDSLMVDIIKQMAHNFPNIKIHLYECERSIIVDMIEREQVDFGLSIMNGGYYEMNIESNMAQADLDYYKLAAFSEIAVVSRNHPMAEYSLLDKKFMRQYAVVAFNLRQDSAFREPLIKAYAGEEHGEINNQDIFYSNDISFHKSIIKNGLGYGLMTDFEFRKIYRKHSYLIAIPIKNAQMIFMLEIKKKGKQLSKGAKIVEKMILNYNFIQ